MIIDLDLINILENDYYGSKMLALSVSDSKFLEFI